MEAACGNALCVDDPDEMPLFGGSESYQQVSDPIPTLPSAEEMKAMALELPDRFSSAGEMLRDMEEFRKNPAILFPFPLYYLSKKEFILL